MNTRKIEAKYFFSNLQGIYYLAQINSFPLLICKHRAVTAKGKAVQLSVYDLYFDGYATGFPGGLYLTESIYYIANSNFDIAKFKEVLIDGTSLTKYVLALEERKSRLIDEHRRRV